MARFCFLVTLLTVIALAALSPAATVTLQGAASGQYTLGSMSVDAQGNIVINLTQVGTPGTPNLSLSPATLPAGTVNTAYSQSVTMSVANPVAGAVYTFGCSGTGIATGLTAAPDTSNSAVCKIGGTPSASGVFTVTFTATDGTTPLQSQTIAFNVNANQPPPPPAGIEITKTTRVMDIPALGQQNFYFIMDKDMVSYVLVSIGTQDWSTNQDVYVSNTGNIDCAVVKGATGQPPKPAPWSTPTATGTEKTIVSLATLGTVPAGTTWYATVCNRSAKAGKYFISWAGN